MTTHTGLPQAYNEVFHEINHRTTTSVEFHTTYTKRAHEQHEKELNELTRATFEYLNTGVANLDRATHVQVQMHGTGWGQRGFSWKQYFRALAKEHKRPFVFTQTGYRYTYSDQSTMRTTRSPYAHYITMPRRKYLAPLMCLFTMCEDTGIVRVSHDTKHTVVTLTGDHGLQLYQQWLSMVTTDIECRKALRVL